MRQIVTGEDIAAAGVGLQTGANSETTSKLESDKYFDRLLKYIPAETVSVYVMAQKGIEMEHFGSIIVFLIVAAIIVGNWFWLNRALKVTRYSQLIISSLALLVWIYTLGDPVKEYLGELYRPGLALILMALFLFVPPSYDFKKNQINFGEQ
jgi:uncharacterized protein (DUF983 family)